LEGGVRDVPVAFKLDAHSLGHAQVRIGAIPKKAFIPSMDSDQETLWPQIDGQDAGGRSRRWWRKRRKGKYRYIRIERRRREVWTIHLKPKLCQSITSLTPLILPVVRAPTLVNAMINAVLQAALHGDLFKYRGQFGDTKAKSLFQTLY
jgi:hypothetical protein